MTQRRRRGDRTALGSYTHDLYQAIQRLAMSMEEMHHKPVLGEREVLSMIAPPEVVEVLTTARALGEVSRYGVSSHVSVALPDPPGIHVTFSLSSDDFLVPRKPVWQDLGHPKLEELRTWAVERIETKFKWGLVNKLLKVLNDKFSSPAQLRYAWPAVLGLMRTSTAFDDLIPQIEEFKRPAVMVDLSPELRAVCQECSQIVATGLLMRDLIEKAPESPVDVSFNISAQRREHPCAEIGAYAPL
jgi:hypothetical protein